MLVTAQIRKDARLLALLLESAKGALKRLALLDPNAGHSISPFGHCMEKTGSTLVRAALGTSA
jgi:hypothetical protein